MMGAEEKITLRNKDNFGCYYSSIGFISLLTCCGEQLRALCVFWQDIMSAFDITKFDPQPSQELICSICYCVLTNALESRCRHVFCKQCIETWLQHHHSCPTCRDYLRRHHLKPVLPLVQNMLNALTVVCDFRDKGCQAPVTMEQYENHIKNCEYQTVKCPNGCEQLLLLKDKQDHEQNTCELRIVKCQLGCELSLPFRQNLAHSCITALKEHIRDKEKQLEGVVAFLQRMVQAVHDLGKTLDIESSRSHLLHRFHDITSQLEQEQHMINQLKKHFMCSVSSASHASEVTSDVSIRALTTSSSSLSSCTAVNASNNSSLPQINLDEEMEQPRTSLLESLVQEAIGSGSRDRRGSIDQVDGYREGDQNEDRIQNRWSMNQSQSRQHVNSTNRSNQEMADPRHQETLEQETVDVGAAENSISSEDEEYLPNYRTSVRHLSPEVTESHGSYSSDTSDGLSDSFASSDDSEYTPINSSLETDDDISDSFTVTSYSFDSPLSEITDDSNSGSHGEDHNRGSEHLASENESSVAEISRPPQGAAVSESHIYSYGSPHLEEEVVVRDGEYLQDDIDQENDNHGISSSGQAVSHVHPQEAGVCLSTCAMFRLRNVLYKPDHGNSIASSSLFHDGQSHTVDKQEGPCYSQELCTGQSNVDLSLDSQMQIEIKEHQTGSKNNLSHLQDTSNIHDTYQINVVINSDSTSLSAEDEHDDNKEMPNSFAQTSDHSSHGSDTIEQPACSSLYAGGCCQITGQFENNSAYAGVRVQDAGTGNDVGAAETEAVTEELSTNVPDDRSSTWHRSRFRDIYTSSDTESDDSRCRRMPRNILSVAGGNTENANSLAPKCQQSLLRKNNLTVITQEAGSSANASPERPCSKRKSACILQEPESKHPRVERKMCSDGGSTERNGVSLVTDTRAVHRKHSHRLSSSTRCTSTACVVSGSTLLSINSSVSAASASLPNPPPWARPNHMTGMAAAASGQTSSNLTPVHGSVASRTRSNCRGLSMQASVTQQPRYSRQTIATSVGSASANGHGLVHIPDIPVPPNTYQLLTAYAEDDETDSTWTPTGSSQSESD